MKDLEVPVMRALLNDEQIATLTKGNIHRWVVPMPDDGQELEYPIIRVIEIDNYDRNYADNKPTISEIPIQIDLWVKGDPTELQNLIDQKMKALQLIRMSVTSDYESDTDSIRKIFRYKGQVKL
ncbi:hypothetical protein AKG34_13365 [Peribacillus butanolivorans]|uniref:DUF3168 domain-containing protein n=1 Tax=Peribacillus butanolivorans TaxID=421767 RepID=UPI0006A6C81E|nr:DUF3168 domain-containing protein [Peribacillus butanolivorans]KON69638.1 hypothetical protein AKG34_13365 [Peribacillus butanolivorans]